MKRLHRGIPVLFLAFVLEAAAQPAMDPEGVRFTYRNDAAASVALVGDFNGWSRQDDPLRKNPSGEWSAVRSLRPGRYQYKFLVDGAAYALDPANPATVDNYNRSAKNSVFILTENNTILLSAVPPTGLVNPGDVYPGTPGKKPIFLNIIWHQHQPLYANPETDQLTGPWVRTHATKDYYDMAAILKNYPDIHCTINLTSSLLLQIREYYVARLRPFVNTKTNQIDVSGFWKKWKGKTDPWIDLALKPTSAFDSTDRRLLYRNSWNAFGINEVMIRRFPEYLALREKLRSAPVASDEVFSEQEMREIKFWFYLAHFDPDFLKGPVKLEDGSVCDVSGYVELRPDGTYHLARKIEERDCRRMVVEAYKVMANVIPVHKSLQYSPRSHRGQIDIITTPYYHPILPLIYDSDLARICQPNDTLPTRFAYPDDARAQVMKAVKMYREIFGMSPLGMWPGEGALAQPVLEILRSNGIVWSATDVKNLIRSDPPNQPNTTPYRFPAGQKSIALVFRDTELSDRIGFKYQDMAGEEAAEDFVRSVLSFAPESGQPDVLLTVILDGENAWEWYRKDNDAKEFLNALYRKLTKLGSQQKIVTTTVSEYLFGNPSRRIPTHPVDGLPGMTSLWPGSWINANYDTWIGEREENTAWEYLRRVRIDLGASGVPRPDPAAPTPQKGTRAWYAFRAWESMYAAEGSDWFWWYGADQEAPGGDKPFDDAFLTHLRNVYAFARQAGGSIRTPVLAPIISSGGPAQVPLTSDTASAGGGTMARSAATTRTVLFVCDARGQAVTRSICIAGSIRELAGWDPNRIALRDDGREGDDKAGDGLWTIRLDLPTGKEIQYKYTNSGEPGQWAPGDEAPGRNRKVVIEPGQTTLILKDTFGKIN
jgi:alpha-amylase/alpha-mannosidase (GH57 family)